MADKETVLSYSSRIRRQGRAGRTGEKQQLPTQFHRLPWPHTRGKRQRVEWSGEGGAELRREHRTLKTKVRTHLHTAFHGKDRHEGEKTGSHQPHTLHLSKGRGVNEASTLGSLSLYIYIYTRAYSATAKGRTSEAEKDSVSTTRTLRLRK